MCVLLGCGSSEPQGGADSTLPLDLPVPVFDLPLLGGGEVSIDDLQGKIAVIDFWATWCMPCLVQIPVLNALRREMASNPDLVILGVAVDEGGASVVASFAAEHGIEYPVLLGSEDLAQRFGAPGFPYLVLVSKEGRIRARHLGVVELGELVRQIESLEKSDPR